MDKNNNSKIKANNLIGRGEFLSVWAVVRGRHGGGPGRMRQGWREAVAGGGRGPHRQDDHRVNKEKGDRVSILGYGCMRWPTRKRADGNGEEIDQETVNGLVDYAISHGVNYFDTSPVYVRGWSETATA